MSIYQNIYSFSLQGECKAVPSNWLIPLSLHIRLFLKTGLHSNQHENSIERPNILTS